MKHRKTVYIASAALFSAAVILFGVIFAQHFSTAFKHQNYAKILRLPPEAISHIIIDQYNYSGVPFCKSKTVTEKNDIDQIIGCLESIECRSENDLKFKTDYAIRVVGTTEKNVWNYDIKGSKLQLVVQNGDQFETCSYLCKTGANGIVGKLYAQMNYPEKYYQRK